jgi:hypothetical protein
MSNEPKNDKNPVDEDRPAPSGPVVESEGDGVGENETPTLQKKQNFTGREITDEDLRDADKK